jgi:hypothetical protein
VHRRQGCKELKDSFWRRGSFDENTVATAQGGAVPALATGRSRARTDAEAPSHCLYRGVLPNALEKAAPYVVELNSDSAFLDFLVRRGWGESWGLYLISPLNLDPVRLHLRRFLKVKDEDGRSLVFRYYDPRVMRDFLPTCDGPQLEMLFDGVDRFLVEDADPLSMSEFTLVDSKLQCASKSWGRG